MLRTSIALILATLLTLARFSFAASVQFKEHPAGTYEFTAGSTWIGDKSPGLGDMAYFHADKNCTLTFAGNVKTSDVRISEKSKLNFSISDGRNFYSWTVLGKSYPQIGNSVGTEKSPTEVVVKLSAGTMNIYGVQFWIGNNTARSPINSAEVIVDGAVMRYFGAVGESSWMQIFSSGALTIQNGGVFEVNLDTTGYKSPLVHPGGIVTLKDGGRLVIVGGKGTVNLELNGTLQGAGTIEIAGQVKASDTSAINPGGDKSAGVLLVKTGALSAGGAVKMELSSSGHDQIILATEGQAAKIANPITYSALPGGASSPSRPFIDFVVADDISYSAQNISTDTANLKGLLAAAGNNQPFTYGIVKVGASDYDGNYVGFDALRLSFTAPAAASR